MIRPPSLLPGDASILPSQCKARPGFTAAKRRACWSSCPADALGPCLLFVDELEKGNVPLEQAIKLFEEGVNLSNSCRQELEAAEGAAPEAPEALAETSERGGQEQAG